MGEQPASSHPTIKLRLLFTPPYTSLITEKKTSQAPVANLQIPLSRKIFDLLTKQLKPLLYSYDSETFQSRTSLLNIVDNSLWRTTKRILSHKPLSFSLLQENNTWSQAEEETAIPSIILSTTLSTPQPFSPSDISSIINSLPLKKAPGYDVSRLKSLNATPKCYSIPYIRI